VPWNGDRNGAICALADRLRAEGRKPFVVPYGVSDALGVVGYASTVIEIAAQSSAVGMSPAAIVHCSGSGGTQAGLVVGVRSCLPSTRVVGIDIDAEPERVRADVVACGEAASRLLGQPFDVADVEVVASHAGPAYGVAHAATVEAIRLGAPLEGLVLDPVYSGKGLAGLISLIRNGRWTKDQDIVFIHTGGAPALFAYQHLFD
jgi:L-cysteate sulfo-lyase